MFAKVQDLTYLIDKNLKWLEEGVASKESHNKDEYEKWLTDVVSKLKGQVARLKEVSCNDKLIARYERKVELVLNKLNLKDTLN